MPERTTSTKLAQVDDWLSGPWRHDHVFVALRGDGDEISNHVIGFSVSKPTDDPREMGLVYAGWPALWAAEHLGELEHVFLGIVAEMPVMIAHAGAMLVGSAGATEVCMAHPEWDVLLLRSPIGITSVSWWTYLAAGFAASSAINAERVVTLRGGRALRASTEPFGGHAAKGQAAVFDALELEIASTALAAPTNAELQRSARHQGKRGRLHRALDLSRALVETGLRSGTTQRAFEASFERYLELGRELHALGLPELDARGRATRVHPTETLGLLPSMLSHAPSLPLDRLAALYARAWEVLGQHRDHHGNLLRATLLAWFHRLGPTARKQSWRDAELYPRIELIGALPALHAAGGVAAVQPFLTCAHRLR